MPKDTGELIFKKSINLCCQPIFSYISSFVIAPNAPFSQSLSHILLYIFLLQELTAIPSRKKMRWVCARGWCVRIGSLL